MGVPSLNVKQIIDPCSSLFQIPPGGTSLNEQEGVQFATLGVPPRVDPILYVLLLIIDMLKLQKQNLRFILGIETKKSNYLFQSPPPHKIFSKGIPLFSF